MSEIVKFTAPEIGVNKAKELKPTNKIVRRVWALQLEQVKEQNVDAPETIDDLEDSFTKAMKLMDDTESFIVDTLKLSKKQTDALEDLTQEELGELCGRLMAAVLGVEKVDESESDEESEPNPKSESANE